mgnify:CR=1 FL=1
MEAIQYDDSVTAASILHKIRKDPSLKLDDKVMTKLKFIRMSSLRWEQLLELLSKSILTAYEIPFFDLNERLQRYFVQEDDMAQQADFLKKFITILENNTELLGSKSIMLKGTVESKQTVANWLSDYLDVAAIEGTDTFTEIKYLNTSSNVKQLTVREKEILKSLIDLLEYSLSFVEMWESIPVPKTEEEAYPEFDLYEFIPGLEDDLREEKSGRGAATEVDADQTVPNQPVTVPVAGDVVAPKEKPKISIPLKPRPLAPTAPYKEKEPVAQKRFVPLTPNAPGLKAIPRPEQVAARPSQTQKPRLIKTPATKLPEPEHTGNAQVHDIINRKPPTLKGVVRDPTNIKLSDEQRRMEQERLQKMRKIQDKLADLRNRKTDQ